MTRSKLLRPLLLGAFAAAPASIAAMGCASEATPPAQVIASPGQLMLAVNTDMMPGKDFDEIRIVVTQDRVTNDSTSFTWTVTEGQVRGSVKLPTTVAVVRGENTSGLTHIRALAYRDGEARVVRDIDVSIPTEGQLLLPIRIEALCVDALRHGKTGTVRSTCDEGSTCIAGGCASTYVDARALATYTPQAVFGGAAAPGASGSKCFDVLAAFSGGFDATPHLEDDACVLTARDLVKPALAGDAGVDGDAGAGDAGAVEGDAGPDQAVHFAGNLAWRQGPGVFGFCTDDLCLVPIPKGSTSGWSVRGTRITVPRAVCDSPEPRIAVSLKGPSVDALVPACGEWSSAGDHTRATAFAEPFVANGSTCGTLASRCAAQHPTCGTIWAKDSHCGLVRLASCGSCDGDTRGMALIPGGNFLLGSAIRSRAPTRCRRRWSSCRHSGWTAPTSRRRRIRLVSRQGAARERTPAVSATCSQRAFPFPARRTTRSTASTGSKPLRIAAGWVFASRRKWSGNTKQKAGRKGSAPIRGGRRCRRRRSFA